MNVERRRRQLLALINDPATFEGERENARRALERLDASKAPPAQAERGGWRLIVDEAEQDGVAFEWDWRNPPAREDFEEMLRRFHAATETPAQRRAREEWEAMSAERQQRWSDSAGSR